MSRIAEVYFTVLVVLAAGALGGTLAELWLPTYVEVGGRALNTGPFGAALLSGVALFIWSALTRNREVEDGRR